MSNDISFLQQQSLYLLQASLGRISSNFRFISISIEDEIINIYICLYEKREEDLEEIEDMESDFESLQLQPVNYKTQIEITNDSFIFKEKSIVIYSKKFRDD